MKARRSIGTRIQEALGASLHTRLSMLFLATVLVPSLAMVFFSIWQTQASARENVLITARGISADAFDSFADTLQAGSDLAQELAFDTTLRNYLKEDFPNTGEAVISFLRRIRPILDYAIRFKGSGIDSARVVMANRTQPESWPYFVSERRMLDVGWYRSFVHSGDTFTWVYPNLSGVYSPFPLEQIVRRPVYTHVRKVFGFQGEYLGSVIVDVPVASVHRGLHDLALPRIDFAVAAAGRDYWHEAAAHGVAIPGVERAAWEAVILREGTGHETEESGRLGPFVYLWRTIPDLDLTATARVHVREQVVESALPKLLVGLVIILGVVALELGTYVILKQIFRRLENMTRIMNDVSGGEFHHRIPVESGDEIGQIARDFNVLIRRIDDLVTESVRRETLQKDAQLKALQFQINPHFIYNTIDSFRMRLLLAGQDDIAESLANFGKLIRYNMGRASLFAPLAEELDIVEKYVDLQRLRNDGRITLSTGQAFECSEVPVLKFLLQPVVENSIRHGLDDENGRDLEIGISAACSNGFLLVSVSDNGRGMTADRLDALREHLALHVEGFDVDGENGIGLANIAGRLALYYGGEASIAVESSPGRGTRIEIRLPARAERSP